MSADGVNENFQNHSATFCESVNDALKLLYIASSFHRRVAENALCTNRSFKEFQKITLIYSILFTIRNYFMFPSAIPFTAAFRVTFATYKIFFV